MELTVHATAARRVRCRAPAGWWPVLVDSDGDGHSAAGTSFPRQNLTLPNVRARRRRCSLTRRVFLIRIFVYYNTRLGRSHLVPTTTRRHRRRRADRPSRAAATWLGTLTYRPSAVRQLRRSVDLVRDRSHNEVRRAAAAVRTWTHETGLGTRPVPWNI